jgi:hypothetical protein
VERLSEPDALASLAWLEEGEAAPKVIPENGRPFWRPSLGWISRRPSPVRVAMSTRAGLGFDPSGWDAQIWILHAMYENHSFPSNITHKDVRKQTIVAGVDSEAGAMLVENLGASQSPGPGWERLRWDELARRLQVDPFADGVPSFASFPYDSWPLNIQPPPEGSLDREQFARLLYHLAQLSQNGDKEECHAFYAVLREHSFGEHVVYRCNLRELSLMYESEHDGSPTNIWPGDRSWFIYTDWDLWGTKVSGNQELARRVLADDQLEAVTLADQVRRASRGRHDALPRKERRRNAAVSPTRLGQ